MFDLYFCPRVARRLRASPDADWLGSLLAVLHRRGYARLTIQFYLREPTLAGKTISPHTLRHTTAMHLLQAGVDITVIALWLGHESPETTHQYVEADVEMKRRVLGRLDEPPMKPAHRPRTDGVLDFLDRL